ncbi:MAG: hypothetical protein WDO74_22680 [Pseudomonadota bacterium]
MLKLFTQFHVLISLLGIASGFVVVFGMLTGDPLDGWTAFFLATTIATSVTGFMFPFEKLLPSHIVGAISLVLLGLAVYARYAAHLAGSYAWIYVVCAVIAQYLNFFVLIVQSFQKIPALKKLAPTQTETPFKIAQGRRPLGVRRTRRQSRFRPQLIRTSSVRAKALPLASKRFRPRSGGRLYRLRAVVPRWLSGQACGLRVIHPRSRADHRDRRSDWPARRGACARSPSALRRGCRARAPLV